MRVYLAQRPKRFLDEASPDLRRRLEERISELWTTPYPSGCKKLRRAELVQAEGRRLPDPLHDCQARGNRRIQDQPKRVGLRVSSMSGHFPSWRASSQIPVRAQTYDNVTQNQACGGVVSAPNKWHGAAEICSGEQRQGGTGGARGGRSPGGSQAAHGKPPATQGRFFGPGGCFMTLWGTLYS